ncbi:AAA family ATPase [Bdellovibrio bacteriovorus]|uniref:AAA family ATPase n=1 Tax=Bdellovibrio bacteriovorus TaxID=959 RepID=UPI0035A65ABD
MEIKKSIGLLRDKKLEIVTRFLTKIVRIEESWSLDEGIESFPYERLSSGQKIATHTIVGVLRTISDYSLVLIDEPETHLHPRLLSSMYFSLLDILHEFNSVSIIASHSQLLAQQVPSRYIQVLRRYDDTIIVQRPSIEFFGADMSQICEEVFRRREDERDFESVLDALLSQNSNSPEKVEKIFDKRLGLAASIYLRSKAEEVNSEKS